MRRYAEETEQRRREAVGDILMGSPRSFHVIARSDLSTEAQRAKAEATKQSSFLSSRRRSWIASLRSQ
jgi:hypothetical protein